VATDPLAETLVEIIADTSPFRSPVLKEIEATAHAAGDLMDRTLSAEMAKVATESANAFGDVLKADMPAAAAEAGAESAVAFGTGFVKVGDETVKVTRDSTGRLRDERGRFVAAGAQAAEGIGQGLEEGSKSWFARLQQQFTLEGIKDGKLFSVGLKTTTEEGAATAANAMTAKFGSFAKTGFLAASTAAAAGTTAITAFGVKSAGDLQQTNVAFTQLTGSAQAAQKEISDLQTFAANTPFEFKDVAKASAQLLAVGQAAGITQQNLIPTLTTIGDVGSAFGVTGAQINGAVLAISQMAGAGKIDMGNLNQLSDNLGGFPARAVVAAQAAKLWGVSTQEAMTRIGNGGLDAQTGIQLLLQGMKEYPGAAGGMAKQSATLNGVLSTFADTARNSLSNAFTPAIPQITAALNDLVPVMQSALDKLGPVISGTLVALLPLVGTFVNSFATIMQPLIPIIAGIAPVLGNLVKNLAPLFAQLITAVAPLLGPITAIIAAFTQLAQIVLPPLIPLISTFTTALANSGISDILVQILDALTPLVPVLGQAFARALAAILPSLPPLVTALTSLALAAAPLAVSFAQVVAAIAPFVAALANTAILNVVVPLIDAFAKGLQVLMPILGPLVQLYVVWTAATKALAIAQAALNLVLEVSPIVLVAGAVVALIGGLVLLYEKSSLVRSILSAVGAVMVNLARAAIVPFVAAWHGLQLAVSAVLDFFRRLPAAFTAALSAVQQVFSAAFTTIIAIADKVAEFFAALPGRIIAELIALPGQLLDLFVAGLGLLLRGIGEALGLIIVAFVELGRGIIYAVTELPGQLAALFTSAISAAYDAVVTGSQAIVSWAVNLLVTIGQTLAALPGQLASLFTSAVSAAYTAVVTAAVAVFNWFTELPGRIVTAIGNIAGVVAGVFVNMWVAGKKAVSDGLDTVVGWFAAAPGRILGVGADMFNAGKTLIQKVFDGFAAVPSIGASLAKSVVNAIIKAINWAIDQVNSGLSNINIAGVGFGDHTIPDIPEWKALGGVFDRPTRIGVGEAGREVVVPLTNPARAAQLAQQSGLLNVLAQAGMGGTGQTINMTVNTVAQNPETVAAIVVGRLARVGG